MKGGTEMPPIADTAARRTSILGPHSGDLGRTHIIFLWKLGTFSALKYGEISIKIMKIGLILEITPIKKGDI
jgi:hypothetical protein